MRNEAEEAVHPKRGRTPLERKYLHADLTPDALIPEPHPSGVLYAKPSEFLRAGRAARVAELTFRSLLLLWNVGVVAGVLVLIATGVLWRAGALAAALAFAALVFSGWIALSAQAYVRWMARNWDRRPQP